MNTKLKKIAFIISFYCLSFGFGAIGFSAFALSPVKLRCENRESPIGIENRNPFLSWQLQAAPNEKNKSQSAYRILVATTIEKLKADRGDLWDSGKINSGENLEIQYAGKPLFSSQKVFWKVRVWDEKGNADSWSDPAVWTMGWLNLADWSDARWIGAPLATDSAYAPSILKRYPYAAIMLRKGFVTGKKVKRALVGYCGLGWSELTINGIKTGNAVLSPEYTDYRKRVSYILQDVTSLLHDGENALGVILGNGFCSTPGKGYLSWYGRGGKPRLLLKLLIEFTDGTNQAVISDESWKWSIGEITFNDLWVGEKVDARMKQSGWDKPGFVDDSWYSAIQAEAPSGRLFARTIPPVAVLKTTQPLSIEGNLFHFDNMATGWLRLKTSGNEGDKIEVLHRAEIPVGMGEKPNPHDLQVGMECILKGQGTEIFEPKFYFHTIGKTVRVEGLKTKSDENTITRCSVGIDLQRTGNFECSNAFLNEQYQNLIRTQVNYNFDYPMDPTREKTGWSQDVLGTIHTSVYDFDSSEFWWNWWKSMRDTQQPNGYLDPVMPQIDISCPDYNGPWWAGMIIYMPWYLYTYQGNINYLKEAYPAMKLFMQYMQSQADSDKVISWGLGDWLEAGAGPENSRPVRTAVPITSTCAYYLYATILQKTATLLGFKSDASEFEVLSNQIKEGFNRRFLDKTTGQVGTISDTQTAHILPLHLGMIPKEIEGLVLKRLVENIHERDDHLSTGFVGTIFLLLGLPEQNQGELIHKMVMQQDNPGWKSMVKDGVQRETWEGGQVQMPALGAPIGAYMYQVLGGIRPLSPGFKKILIKPSAVGDLTFVKCHHDSPYGRIESNWRIENGKFSMEVSIPANTTATVVLPDGSSHETGSGKYLFFINKQ